MDFIIGLLLLINLQNNKLCNIILIIVNRLIKYAIYILIIMRLISSGLVKLLAYYIFLIYGLLNSIVSN